MQTVAHASKFQEQPAQELDGGLDATPPVYELPAASRDRQ